MRIKGVTETGFQRLAQYNLTIGDWKHEEVYEIPKDDPVFSDPDVVSIIEDLKEESNLNFDWNDVRVIVGVSQAEYNEKTYDDPKYPEDMLEIVQERIQEYGPWGHADIVVEVFWDKFRGEYWEGWGPYYYEGFEDFKQDEDYPKYIAGALDDLKVQIEIDNEEEWDN